MVKQKITIHAEIKAPVEKVWNLYTDPDHLMKWNNPSEDWHTTRAENDLRVGGKFFARMEAKDGSAGFDFEGIYNKVKTNQLIEYTMTDGRKVEVVFTSKGDNTQTTVIFDAEDTNPIETQKQGWFAILNNFKKYVEAIS